MGFVKLDLPHMSIQKTSDTKIDKKSDVITEPAEETTAVEKPLNESGFEKDEITEKITNTDEYSARALMNSGKRFFNVLDLAASLRGKKKIT